MCTHICIYYSRKDSSNKMYNTIIMTAVTEAIQGLFAIMYNSRDAMNNVTSSVIDQTNKIIVDTVDNKTEVMTDTKTDDTTTTEINSNANISTESILSIYVLLLENNKYYVGKTKYPDFRIEQHFNASDSEWCRLLVSKNRRFLGYTKY
jgi:hypothetical protein